MTLDEFVERVKSGYMSPDATSGLLEYDAVNSIHRFVDVLTDSSNPSHDESKRLYDLILFMLEHHQKAESPIYIKNSLIDFALENFPHQAFNASELREKAKAGSGLLPVNVTYQLAKRSVLETPLFSESDNIDFEVSAALSIAISESPPLSKDFLEKTDMDKILSNISKNISMLDRSYLKGDKEKTSSFLKLIMRKNPGKVAQDAVLQHISCKGVRNAARISSDFSL